MAHEHAPAATLAPLTYLGIVSATALGYLVFDELPDPLSGVGAAIVIASGLALWWQGRRG
jgi:S-adenosylmethionine uptake transporter